MRRGAGQFMIGRLTGAGFTLALFLVLGALVPTGAPLFARQIQVEGRNYIDLATVAGHFGMNAYWLKGYKTYRLKSQWTTIDFGKNGKVVELNKMPVYLGFPVKESQGRLYVAQADFQHVLKSILTPQAFRPRPGLRRIVIDAGHGGKDSGAVNEAYRLQEKKLALDVANRLKRLLEQVGYEVIMTRKSDVYIPLDRRPAMANRANGDLFVSIHFNAAASSSAHGYETFALTPQYQASSKYPRPTGRDNTRYEGNGQDAWNTLAAYHLQRALVNRLGGPDRGVKRARFLVLKHLECPGVLVELGFMSHAPTAQKLRGATHRQTIAQALFEGIVGYRNRLSRIR